MTPEGLRKLVEELEALPGIGRRTAERLAHHLLRVPEENALALAEAIVNARRRVRPCSVCRAPAEADPCPVCSDPSRDHGLVAVVETARDLAALEAGGVWRGTYHVLGGRLSPLDGAGPDALDLDRLVERVRREGVREVILATNPDLEGDGTALLVARALRDAVSTNDPSSDANEDGVAGTRGVRVTRLARGLPSGGQLEHQSAPVLADAFEGRREVAS